MIFPETAERVAQWREDPTVLGVLLVGSKSHEHNDALSDDDLEVVLSNDAYSQLQPKDCIEVLAKGEGAERKLLYDAQLIGLPQLAAKVESHFDLDHWPYEHARILFDRDGQLSTLVERPGSMEPEFRRLRLAHATIDAWIAIYRAKKTSKRGAEASVRVLIVRAARAITRIVFALESRWVPLDHWLEAELMTLDDPVGVVPLLVRGLVEGDAELFGTLLQKLEDRLAEDGVPRAIGRRDLFLELIHFSRSAERAIHGLV